MLPGGPPETRDVSFLPYPPSPQLPITGSRLCLYEDGTELTGDYFSSVPDNSELVLLTSGQTWQGYVSDIHHFLHAFHKPQAGLIQAARQLLSGEQAPLRQKLLADLLHTVSENTEAETRAEDPPWFEGLESRFKNKSGYLRYSCESRIRSYLREVSASASTVGAEAQEEYVRIVGLMCRKLRAEQYHSSYFDRGAEADSRLCTPEGWFSCQGPFDVDSCASKHSINPYGNRESRILFSTWNLDHMRFRPSTFRYYRAPWAERARGTDLRGHVGVARGLAASSACGDWSGMQILGLRAPLPGCWGLGCTFRSSVGYFPCPAGAWGHRSGGGPSTQGAEQASLEQSADEAAEAGAGLPDTVVSVFLRVGGTGGPSMLQWPSWPCFYSSCYKLSSQALPVSTRALKE
ncbi:DNA fragmentation factor subunit beta isoform X2 [Prionailurus viverrinus]|uniref:DNA fragmentation factor subunit beta isoform X2 n=1 Tax=Prionailurus viverrinus TaxID=61388 RepID=UPI001FF46C8A|nr:DNA fragmentation factor subunit beta isoform X2 [Prionailurus viverrinus]